MGVEEDISHNALEADCEPTKTGLHIHQLHPKIHSLHIMEHYTIQKAVLKNTKTWFCELVYLGFWLWTCLHRLANIYF